MKRPQQISEARTLFQLIRQAFPADNAMDAFDRLELIRTVFTMAKAGKFTTRRTK